MTPNQHLDKMPAHVPLTPDQIRELKRLLDAGNEYAISVYMALGPKRDAIPQPNAEPSGACN